MSGRDSGPIGPANRPAPRRRAAPDPSPRAGAALLSLGRRLCLRVLAACLFCLAGLPATAQGYAGLGTEAEGYAAVAPGVPLDFPRDHGPHPRFRIEWWYLTANLQAADGAPLGLQWTLFRQAMQPGGADEGWRSPQLWMGHAAVTTAETHAYAELFARGGIGQAGVRLAPFEAWIDDWAMVGATGGDPFDRLTLSARGERFSYRLELTAEGPLVRHGAEGYSVKSDAGQASYYYSQPFYRVAGSVTLDGTERQVTGRAWLDREWSSQPLTEAQTGWDWLSLHLPGGAKLMVYGMRQTGGRDYLTGTYIAADGTAEPLVPGSVVLTPGRTEQVAGREIPITWRVEVPAKGIDLTARALNPQSYMGTVFPYWEGPVTFGGSHAGVGYLEMTGY